MYKQQSIKVSKGAKIRNRYNQVPHLTNVLAEDNLGVLFNNGVYKKKMYLLNVDNIGQNMGEEIYSITLFNRL